MAYNRKAQEKYRNKSINMAICYRPQETFEALRFKSFLEVNNYSANAYIKELIKKDMDAKKVPYPTPEKTE